MFTELFCRWKTICRVIFLFPCVDATKQTNKGINPIFENWFRRFGADWFHLCHFTLCRTLFLILLTYDSLKLSIVCLWLVTFWFISRVFRGIKVHGDVFLFNSYVYFFVSHPPECFCGCVKPDKLVWCIFYHKTQFLTVLNSALFTFMF